ncbi:MAG: phage Gp37/Gp68 family protein [Candidatus Margulisiibacteriota bacterium]
MSTNSSIEWTEATWNPITGCTKISSGCLNCYAERMAYRLKAMGQENYKDGFNLSVHEDMFDLPLKWKKPRTIFVNSMSDLFHEKLKESIILELFKVMREASWHDFQILTKRAERLDEINEKIQWPDNVWMGVTIENGDYLHRLESLKKSGARNKFLSLEPLIGPIKNIDLDGIDWVIVGGESGPFSRPIKPEWVSRIRDLCIAQNVPFFFKQWGGKNKKKNGRLLEGKIWDQRPLVAAG